MHDRYDEEDEDEQDRIARIFFDNETPRDQYREGYPNATEPEIRMLLDAEKKNGGTPPSNLDHAKIILSDNVWIFKPRRRSPFGRSRADGEYFPTRPVHWRPWEWPKLALATAAMLDLARTMKIIAGKDLRI
jgi:hypothetical protein